MAIMSERIGDNIATHTKLNLAYLIVNIFSFKIFQMLMIAKCSNVSVGNQIFLRLFKCFLPCF